MRELSTREKKILTALDDRGIRRNRIAQMMGLTPAEVSHHAQKLGLVPRKYPTNLERVEMVRDLVNRGVSVSDIAKQLDITPSGVYAIIKVGRAMASKAFQIKKAAAQGLTRQQLADKFGISVSTVNYYLTRV